MKKTKFRALIAALLLPLMLTSCASDSYTREGGEITTSDINEKPVVTTVETAEVTTAYNEKIIGEEDIPEAAKTITDREGNEIPVPERLDRIVSAAPCITEILSGLGFSEKIIAADIYSADVEGIDPAVCTLDFYNLNAEELIALEPDVVIINGISVFGESDPYQSLKDAGINVVYVPTSSSISSVKLDIDFLAAYTGSTAEGSSLIASIDSAVSEISAKAAAVAEKKKVYFEIGAAPYLYTCGSGTFIDEMITLVGAENIYGGENGYISNSDETVIAGDPDVIITNVMYDGYDFTEISSREGWEVIKAVQNGEIYQVDANSTSRASQNIIKGIYEIAKAVYPEIFAE